MDTPRRWPRWLRRLLLYPLLVVLVVGLFVFVMTTRYPQQVPPEMPQALTGATVLVGPDLEPRDDTTVLIRDGIIETVGPAAEVEIPAGAAIVDLRGTTLLPGLIDTRVHVRAPGPGWRALGASLLDGIRHAPDQRQAMLEHGVTPFRSLGDDTTWILELRRLVADGTLEGPRVFAAGPMVTSAGGHPVQSLHGGQVIDGLVSLPQTPEEA